MSTIQIVATIALSIVILGGIIGTGIAVFYEPKKI
jgi:hypothetical protein